MSVRVARRILYVIGSLEIGGTETHLLSVAGAMAADGMDVYVFSLAGKGPLLEAFEKAGVNVLVMRRHSFGRSIWGRTFAMFMTSIHLFSAMVRLRPSLVHFFLPAAYLVGAPLAILTRQPIRIMSRRSMNLYQKKMPILGRIEHRLHRTMTVILANSDLVLAQLRDEEGVSRQKLRRIYNGVDLTRFVQNGSVAQSRKKLGIGDDALVMTTVANLIAYKGHADLLDALTIARDKLPAGWRLLIAGRDDGIGAQLRAQAAASGLSDNVLLLGSRDDIPDLLQTSDIGLLCSHEEGFSNAILEGMAAGLPMIVTDVGGNAEAVIDGETGIVVPAHAPDRIAAAILALAIDAERRKKFGAAGRSRAEQEFSNARCVQQYSDFYRSLNGESAPVS